MSMFVVLMGVFSFLFASNPTYKLNLIVGLFLWDFFAEGDEERPDVAARERVSADQGARPAWILVVTSMSNAVITLGRLLGSSS